METSNLDELVVLVHEEEEENEESKHCSDVEQGEEDLENENESETEFSFSFMCGEAKTSPITAEDAFSNGKIKPIYPQYHQFNLPMKPPSVKLFIETNPDHQNSSSSSTSGPYCEWSDRKAVEATTSPVPETCKKSNSTGFSKIWRFKDFLGRSNSDGRDAFVFLNNNNEHNVVSPVTTTTEDVVVKAKGKGGSSNKTASSLSAHEVYLNSKAKKKGDEKRRSYLPYKPQLGSMGFFTNVNGGLTKNVHPF